MREPYLSGAIFALGVGLVVFVQILNLPPKPSEEALLKRQRDERVVEYLFLKSDLVNQSQIEPFLEKLEKEAVEQPQFADLAVLFLGLEGRKSQAQTLWESFEDSDRKALLGYGLGFADRLPPDWQSLYPPGWVQAKIAAQVYDREGDEAQYASSLVSIREYENVTHRFASINALFQFMGFMGFIFLVGMLFSRRYHQLMGKDFFLLHPIYVSPTRLLRFCGLLLLGFVLTGSMASWVFSGVQSIGALISGYFLFVLVSLYLVHQVYFEPGQGQRLQVLQLDNLRMRFAKLWQILKAVCILVSLCLAGIAFSYWFGWSIDRFELNSLYQRLLEQPFSAGILFFFACIVAPIFEELIFRGMIQRGLLSSGKPVLAILGSALIFTFIHPMAQWPTTLAIGLGLGLVYQRTGDLLVCIWAHAAWNGMVLLLLSNGIIL